MLIELLKNVEECSPVLLFLLVFHVQRVVFLVLFDTLRSIQVLRRVSASRSHESLWLIVSFLDFTRSFHSIFLEFIHVPPFESEWTKLDDLVPVSFTVFVLNFPLVLLLDHRSVCHLLEQSIFVLDRVVVSALIIRTFLQLVLVASFLLFRLFDHLTTLENEGVLFLDGRIEAFK